MTTLPQGWHRAVGAISLLWLATALGAGMTFGSQALLARELEPAGYGLFTSSLAMITMVAPLAGFGLAQFWLKAYGAEGWAANRWLRPSMRFLSVSTLLTMLLIAAWAITAAPADATPMLLILLPVVLGVLAASLIGTKLRLEERHGALAAWQLATPGSRLLVAVMLLLVPSLTSRFVAVGFAVISLGVAALATPELRAMLHGEMKLHGHGPRPAPAASTESPAPGAWSVWSQAWAFGLSAVLYPVFFQISTVLVKYFDGNVRAGIFGIALAVMTAIYLIPTTVFQKYLLSKQHRWAVHDPKKFWMVYRRGNVAMLVAGLALGAAVAVLAPWAVPLAFGEKYRPVVPVLMVLAWCVPIRFMAIGIGSALLSERHMRYRVFAMGLSALVVIALNVVLIPSHHEIGAAIATVVGETVLLLALYGGVRRFHPLQERAS
ncbi:lipopolysaccharide biosynthesis protein [Dyella sp.]|jgi:O-antigen/teichoic acid export membrane protein|uniref:lipopolysaccharide biosynthesis protein n=1 Tax=Dyella sp. TaxID=1869338 RepID=UPI002D7984BB|nr:polysaccharide biosynthesis C-terminal domain-containing protein [Dyella sp.]HET6431604.1 polysaccharide biosynthesis C-terminal domain-containing protein [Dyella sp.]